MPDDSTLINIKMRGSQISFWILAFLAVFMLQLALAAEDGTDMTFQQYKSKFGIKYRDGEDEKKHEDAFRNRVKMIKEANKDPNRKNKLFVNKLAGYTDEELKGNFYYI